VKAVNLIPADERAGVGGAAGRSGGAVWVLVGGLAGLVIMAGVYALSVRHVADSRAKDAVALNQTAGARSRATRLAPYQQFFTTGHARITQVATLVKGRYDWSSVMHGIAVTLPSDVSLTTLTASLSPAGGTAAVAGTSAPAAPAPAAASTAPAASATGTTRAAAAQVSPTVLLGGCARSHPEVAHVLDALGGMSGVQNVSFASSTKGAATQAAGAGAGGCPPSSPAVFQVTITLRATGALGASVSPAVAAQSAASPSAAAANAPAIPSARPPAPVAPGALGSVR